jgi:hypothetical protein
VLDVDMYSLGCGVRTVKHTVRCHALSPLLTPSHPQRCCLHLSYIPEFNRPDDTMTSKYFTWTKGDRRNATEALRSGVVVPIPIECISIKGLDYARTSKVFDLTIGG